MLADNHRLNRFLHSGYVASANQFNSAQGAVQFVVKTDDPQGDEYVIKQFTGKMVKYYDLELNVLKKIRSKAEFMDPRRKFKSSVGDLVKS